MDLSSFEVVSGSNEGSKIVIRHPITGGELSDDNGQVTITVLGEQSDVYQKALKASVNRRLAMQSKRKGNIVTLEEMEADEQSLLVVSVKAWENIVIDGEKLECTPANIRKLFGDKRMKWMKDQVVEATRDDKNFMKS